VDACRRIAQSGLYPSDCRLLDRAEARLPTISMDGDHVLLLAFECADRPRSADLDRALAIVGECGGRLKDGPTTTQSSSGSAGAWRQMFLEAPYLHTTLVSLGLVVDTFETACTWDRFDALDRAIRAAVGAELDARGGGTLACRFTHVYPDGPAPYYTFLVRGDPDPLAAWQAVKAAASRAIIGNHGTITHHHAVGRTHRSVWAEERSAPFAHALAAAKSAVDPEWILNPGALLTTQERP